MLVVEHLPGRENGAADALSRDNLSAFLLQVEFARPLPLAIPDQLLDLLVRGRPDWMSVSWTELLSTNF